MDSSTLEQLALTGLACTGMLLLIACLTKLTNGLFIARFPHEFIRDRHDPSYRLERRAGKTFSHFVFTYIPPFFIGFLLLHFLAHYFY